MKKKCEPKYKHLQKVLVKKGFYQGKIFEVVNVSDFFNDGRYVYMGRFVKKLFGLFWMYENSWSYEHIDEEDLE